MIITLGINNNQLFKKIMSDWQNNRCVLCGDRAANYKWIVYRSVLERLHDFLLKNKFPECLGEDPRITMCSLHSQDGDFYLKQFTERHFKELS